MLDGARRGKNPEMQVQSRRSVAGTRHRLDLEMPAMSGLLTDVRSAFAELPVPASALDDARLLVGELVANSVRHARIGPNDTIRVAAEVENGTLRVDVIDGGRGGEAARGRESARLRGRSRAGVLVETLATRWGHAAGRYWFELEIVKPRRRSSAGPAAPRSRRASPRASHERRTGRAPRPRPPPRTRRVRGAPRTAVDRSEPVRIRAW